MGTSEPPKWIKPQLTRLVDEVPAAKDWLHEIKYDGYAGATVLVKKVLDQERLISAEQDPKGVLVMNAHKSKGKEFDGVILIEGEYKSFFFDTKNESPPFCRVDDCSAWQL